MPRPKRSRKVFRPPLISGFLPFGSSAGSSGGISLLYEEYEAMRLADYEGLTQQEAAGRMEVSRPTFSRIYDLARQKLAKALVEGLTLTIEGGSILFDEDWYRCNNCQTAFSPSGKTTFVVCPVCRSSDLSDIRKNGRGSVPDLLPRPAIHQTGFCVCSRCGLKVSHQAGIPCRSLVCPVCSTPMIREHHPVSP